MLCNKKWSSEVALHDTIYFQTNNADSDREGKWPAYNVVVGKRKRCM
jgi:hypothetical protein